MTYGSLITASFHSCIAGRLSIFWKYSFAYTHGNSPSKVAENSTPYSFTSRLFTASTKNLENSNVKASLSVKLGYIEIGIPPLRNRQDEFYTTSKLACIKLAKDGHGSFTIDDQAFRLLREYSWPGNTIELRNAVNKAIVYHTTKTDVLTFEDFGFVVGDIMRETPIEDRESTIIKLAFIKASDDIELAAKILQIDKSELNRKLHHFG